MQCDFCDSKATVFFTQILDGVTKKSCLCDSCAAEKGVTDPEGFLMGMEGLSPADQVQASEDLAQETQPRPATDDKASCTSCGFAFDDLKKTGRLGCSECYSFFRDEIKHNLSGMHKGIIHKGRVPEGMMEEFQKRQRLEALTAEMASAISAEDYEKAAKLRDQIKQLEEEPAPTTDS